MKNLLQILVAVIALLFVVGCATTDYQAFYRAQADFNNRETRQLFVMEAQPGETIVLGGVARLIVNQPMDDQAPQQWRRQPGAAENIATAIGPAAIIGGATMFGIREQSRTARFNTEQNTIRDVALYDMFAGQGSAPALDAGQFFDGTTSIIDSVGNIVSPSMARPIEVAPIDLQPDPVFPSF